MSDMSHLTRNSKPLLRPFETTRSVVVLSPFRAISGILLSFGLALAPVLLAVPADSQPATSVADAEQRSAEADAQATSEPSSRSPDRKPLQGKTRVVEYRLNDMESYRAGMAAMNSRNFAAAAALFKGAAAKLDDGYEKYRGECMYFQGKCLALSGKVGEAGKVLNAAVDIFEQYDPKNPYLGVAIKQISDLESGAARSDTPTLSGNATNNIVRLSIEQNITFGKGRARADMHLLKLKEQEVPATVHNCFAEMTCLETAEIGSNIYTAPGKWRPLLVQGSPAAIATGSDPLYIIVKVSGHQHNISLPRFQGTRKILLMTDNEKICAVDMNTYETWLLSMDINKDSSLHGVRWTKLAHKKDASTSRVGVSAAERAAKHVRPRPSSAENSFAWSAKTSTKVKSKHGGGWENSGKTSRKSEWGKFGSTSSSSWAGWNKYSGGNSSGSGTSSGSGNIYGISGSGGFMTGQESQRKSNRRSGTRGESGF